MRTSTQGLALATPSGAITAEPRAAAATQAAARAAGGSRVFWAGAALLWLTAGVATAVCFDPAQSLRPFALLTAGLLAAAAIARGLLRPAWAAAAMAAAGAGLAVYFVLQNDFAARSKFALVRALSEPFQGLVPDLGWHKPHPNVAAGGLEVALPFCVALACSGRRVTRILASAAAVVCGFGLVLTESRGAWAALGLAGAGAGAVAIYRAQRGGRFARWAGPGLLGAVLLAGVLGAAGLLWTLRDPALLRSAVLRATLYRQAAALTADYPFTGAGLGVFEPTYTQYILFYSAPPEPHAHDLWLDLAISQGAGGVLGYAALTAAAGAAAWRALRAQRAPGGLWWASLVAWGTVLIHGLADDVHYTSLTLPVLLVVPALLGATAPARQRGPIEGPRRGRRRLMLTAAAGSLLVILGLGAAGRQPLTSLVESNIGNLAQARLDLAGSQSGSVRRSG